MAKHSINSQVVILVKAKGKHTTKEQELGKCITNSWKSSFAEFSSNGKHELKKNRNIMILKDC